MIEVSGQEVEQRQEAEKHKHLLFAKLTCIIYSMFDKDKRVLILVESPEKAKTISKIFKDAGYNKVVVKATIGHFTKLKDGTGYYNTGIHVDDNFKMDFITDSSKKDNITELKQQVKLADFIYLCGDPDREGEAICWSCVKFLGIPKNKYKRAFYHAINQKDIFEGIENASDVDYNLVDAAHARQCIDKLIGYRLSSIAKRGVGAKSVGRVQSPSLKMIVDREKEIMNFKPETYYDLFLHFTKGTTEFKAKYCNEKGETLNFKSFNECDEVIKECEKLVSYIYSVENKTKYENPKAPFSTATFQQECSSKLGLTVSQSQNLAQKLFDAGFISYHRTDDEQFGEEFEAVLKDFVNKTYDKEYISGTVTKGKKDENAQNGHEALHVLDLTLTPDKFAKNNDELLTKVYRIIYNRTVACALKPAQYATTKYIIKNGQNHYFVLNSKELKFAGYRLVYGSYVDVEDEEVVKETFKEGENLLDSSYNWIEKTTNPPSRFKEASFVKEMKDAGIGRPSTYASTIDTLKSESRGYCVVEDKCLKPTDLGIRLSDFLDERFSDLVGVQYTAEMEKDLDQIANGKLDYQEFLKSFFDKLESLVKDAGDVEMTCPNCGKPMKLRKGPYGEFFGCTGYPDYKTTIKK